MTWRSWSSEPDPALAAPPPLQPTDRVGLSADGQRFVLQARVDEILALIEHALTTQRVGNMVPLDVLLDIRLVLRPNLPPLRPAVPPVPYIPGPDGARRA